MFTVEPNNKFNALVIITGLLSVIVNLSCLAAIINLGSF